MIKFNIKKFSWIFAIIMLIGIPSVFAEDLNFDPFVSESQETGVTGEPDSGPVIPQVEFSNNDISMAFQIISDSTGWSIFPTSDVSKAKISFWAKNISAKKLLDTIVELAGFIYHREGNVIRVMTYEEYQQYHGLARQIFNLKYADASSVEAAIKPFLSKIGKAIVHKQTNNIVIYETQANLDFVSEVMKQLDSPAENILIEVINLKYANSEELSIILQSVFTDKDPLSRNKGQDDAQNIQQDSNSIILSKEQMQIHSAKHSNQIVVVGKAKDIEKVKAFVKQIDILSENMVLEVIDLKYADSQVIAETLQKLFENKDSEKSLPPVQQNTQPSTTANQQSSASSFLLPYSKIYIQSIGRTNQLIVKAYNGDIEKIKQLIGKLDTYTEPMTQNYQLFYIDATEVFTGLERTLNLNTRSVGSREKNEQTQGISLIEKTNSILLTGPPSAHRIMKSIIEKVDQPSIYETGMIRIYKLENADVDEVAKTISDLLEPSQERGDDSSDAKFANQASGVNSSSPDMAESEKFVSQIEARVSVNKSINSIIVQATARQHRELEKLIENLDQRRKQVLIEAMIVEITTTDNLNLGVELSNVSIDDIAFSAFGLSTGLNLVTGSRNITVSPGGSAVLRSGEVQAIIQALKQDGNARITSAPTILVNDNSVGFINSVAEEPTTQTNQGENTTTTSFAGFVEAGTQFAITPHISEKDFLRVEYQITLNSFGVKPTDPSIPPPRNTSSIQSEATIPNGYTIIVGGLQTTDESENIDKVPFLGDIPILEWAFKNTDIEKQYKTTYLFITPKIIKSEDFEDLKQESQKALEEIEMIEVINEDLNEEENGIQK